MNRTAGRICIAFFSVISITTLFAQDITKREFIRSVQDADMSFYYDEDYERAASLYEPLLKAYPGNSNLAAKLGICYLNIDGKEPEALNLLSKASSNVVSRDLDYVEYGEKAPLDTYLYLGVAYHVNDSLDKAIYAFKDAKGKLAESDIFREDYLDKQISSCSYALETKKRPLTILSNLFVPWLKEYPGACNPVISENDSVFIFTQKTEGKTRILCSYKTDKWNIPTDITKELGGYDRFYSNSITGDGKLLVVFLDDGGDGNLYFCHRNGTKWTKIQSPGKNINSIYWESHGFITPDGKTIYISSNRPAGEGELDLWSSTKNEDNTWNKPVNLGKTINTPYNEETPFFDPVSEALIFSSAGHKGMGGYDVFRSILSNGDWTIPVGMPYAFNDTGNNTFFILNNNGPGFLASIYNEKENFRNIYALVARAPEDEITLTEGIVTLNDGSKPEPGKVSVKLTDLKKPSAAKLVQADAAGKFRFDIVPGDYKLEISYPGYKTDTKVLNLPLYFLSRYMEVSSTLSPEEVTAGKYLSIKNILFEFNSFKLDSQDILVLEELKGVLLSNPELKIEIAGYTDPIGSKEYNRILAGQRAGSVLDYLISEEVPASRFVKKAAGETDFVAVNTKKDGTDYPEGRKYNRRVTFGIIDPETGIILRQDTYTPDHLRLPSSMKYSVVLKRSREKLSLDDFKSLGLGGRLFVRSVESDTLSIYSLGVFSNRPDALKYLSYVKSYGFPDAYIINQYDLNDDSKYIYKLMPVVSNASGKRIYTIQVKATRSPVNLNIFKEIDGVREILSDDGFYRYVTGEFEHLTDAKKVLKAILDEGFDDAFIRELNLLTVE